MDPPVDNADGISVGCMVFLCLIFPLGGLASDLVEKYAKINKSENVDSP